MDNNIILANDFYSEELKKIIEESLCSIGFGDDIVVQLSRPKLYAPEGRVYRYSEGRLIVTVSEKFELTLLESVFGKSINSGSSLYKSLLESTVDVFLNSKILPTFSEVEVEGSEANEERPYLVDVLLDETLLARFEFEHVFVERSLHHYLFNDSATRLDKDFLYSLISQQLVELDLVLSGARVSLSQLVTLKVGDVIVTDRPLHHGVTVISDQKVVARKAFIANSNGSLNLTIGSIDGK